MNLSDLKKTAALRRADAVTMIARAKTGHTGGAMSSLDVLTCLFYEVKRPGDHFLLSKGHSVEGYWAILADLGFFPKAELNTYSQPGSPLIGHPNNKVPGVEMSTGALGHGLPIGVGMAISEKRLATDRKVFVLMGDGEQAEGSVWEAAMAGANYRLDNLWAVVDRNGLQISGSTEDVMALENFADKWRAFGWDVAEADGNDMGALVSYFTSDRPAGKPHCLIAKTVKGKGLPFAENRAEWHHHVPSAEQLATAYEALGVKGVDWA
jgi:transketolase